MAATSIEMKEPTGGVHVIDIAQDMDRITDRAMAHVPLKTISVREGFNPISANLFIDLSMALS